LLCPKYTHNVAGALRACANFEIPTLLWSGTRVTLDAERERIPREERMKGYRTVEFQQDDRPLLTLTEEWALPDATPVCVEIREHALPLQIFTHPPNAVYVFGPEDGEVPQVYRRLCHYFVRIPSLHCLNLAAAVNVVLYDRTAKLGLKGTPEWERIQTYPLLDITGWDGR
jgi:tRNA(Leu) C34 or U34 (ribose-2'-O)-methylase TrmL